MGIKDLAKVIADHAERAVREADMKAFFGRKVAIDASMSLYQFLIAVRQDGAQLVNDKGETTSHLNGMFYRTIRMMEHGLKPAYVFDGKPPEMKADELEKRRERRQETEKEMSKAKEEGDTERVNKLERRMVRVTPEQNEQCKELLRAMGVPVVDAPAEAEAQCAELARKGKVYAAGTEDMDALTFGSTVLLRHLTFSEVKKVPIKEYCLDKLLSNFNMEMPQFVDLCIMLGCDYCDTIRGVGPKKAFDLIIKHKSIENVLENLDTKKFPPPENWNYEAARKLFLEPMVEDGDKIDLVWNEPNEQEIWRILVTENNFQESRIKTGIERLKKNRNQAQQGRIDSFFQPLAVVSTEKTSKKRAEEAEIEKVKSGAKKPGAPKRKAADSKKSKAGESSKAKKKKTK